MGPQDSLLFELLPFLHVCDITLHLSPTSLLNFFFPISFVGFCLYLTENTTVSSGSILALFYLYFLVRLFYNPMGFNAIYMLTTLKLISTAKTFLQTPPTHLPTGRSNWMSIKDFKF